MVNPALAGKVGGLTVAVVGEARTMCYASLHKFHSGAWFDHTINTSVIVIMLQSTATTGCFKNY